MRLSWMYLAFVCVASQVSCAPVAQMNTGGGTGVDGPVAKGAIWSLKYDWMPSIHSISVTENHVKITPRGVPVEEQKWEIFFEISRLDAPPSLELSSDLPSMINFAGDFPGWSVAGPWLAPNETCALWVNALGFRFNACKTLFGGGDIVTRYYLNSTFFDIDGHEYHVTASFLDRKGRYAASREPDEDIVLPLNTLRYSDSEPDNDNSGQTHDRGHTEEQGL